MGRLKIEKTCQVCGKTYNPRRKTQRFCCKECENEHRRMLVRKTRKLDRIDEINAKAKAAGMSYGQYVAMEHMRNIELNA